ncbi:hypothetical protein TNCV_2909981 [Trichonephila clavipes]|nr:hypothetical protein TNCV_2909981 [Trichonephila clavipes]
MPFALQCARLLERLMETVLKGLTFEACLIYLDDVIIGGVRLKDIFKNIRKRCSLTPEKVSAVKNWKRPENLRELEASRLCTLLPKSL